VLCFLSSRHDAPHGENYLRNHNYRSTAMKQAELLRTYLPTRTSGKFCFGPQGLYVPVIERPKLSPAGIENAPGCTCIPEGVYLMRKGVMVHHNNAEHYMLLNVPGRTGIFLHFIDMSLPNPEEQLEGCIGGAQPKIIQIQQWGNWEDIQLTIKEAT
jgi:hypothetical protein